MTPISTRHVLSLAKRKLTRVIKAKIRKKKVRWGKKEIMTIKQASERQGERKEEKQKKGKERNRQREEARIKLHKAPEGKTGKREIDIERESIRQARGGLEGKKRRERREKKRKKVDRERKQGRKEKVKERKKGDRETEYNSITGNRRQRKIKKTEIYK